MKYCDFQQYTGIFQQYTGIFQQYTVYFFMSAALWAWPPDLAGKIRVGWSDFWRKKTGSWELMPNCNRIPIPKFHFEMLIFNLAQGLTKFVFPFIRSNPILAIFGTKTWFKKCFHFKFFWATVIWSKRKIVANFRNHFLPKKLSTESVSIRLGSSIGWAS